MTILTMTTMRKMNEEDELEEDELEEDDLEDDDLFLDEEDLV